MAIKTTTIAMSKHKHQFFEIEKVSKYSERREKVNNSELQDWSKRRDENKNPDVITLGPFLLEPDINGVLIMCPCGERRKLWDTGEVEIIKND